MPRGSCIATSSRPSAKPVDHRADLFSLGCVMYAMLTGRPPFRADSTLAVIRRVCEDTPRPIQEVNEDTPDWLVEIIDKLLAKNPDDRFQSAAEVAELLGEYLAHVQQPSTVPKPVGLRTEATELIRQPAGRARGRGWAIAAVLLLLLGGLATTEATGVTNVREFVATVLRIRTPDGTLVVELNDPEINVRIDGEEITLSNVGPHEIRLSPGRHRLQATKEGAPVRSEWVTITRDGKQVVKVDFDRGTPAAESELHATGATPQQVEPDTASQIRMLIPEASAMARQDMERLTKSATAPKASAIVEKSLTLMLLALEPKDDNQAKEQFQLVADGISRPAEIVQEIYRGQDTPKGTKPGTSVTFIHADRITDFTCDADGDTAAGEVSFEVPELYQGKVKYVARRTDGQWQIEEFTMPAYDIHIVRDGKGLWEKQSARPTATLTEVRRFEGGNTKQVVSIGVSPDGRLMLSGDLGGGLYLWDLETGEALKEFIGHGPVNHVVFSRDGRSIFSCSSDQTARRWDVETAREIRRYEGHTSRITTLAVSPDEKRLVTGSAWYDHEHQGIPKDNSLRLWDIETGKEVRRFEGVLYPIKGVAFSPDGKSIVAGGEDEMLGVWDVETGKLTSRFTPPENVGCVAFSPDGSKLACGQGAVNRRDGKVFDPERSVIILWDIQTGREIRRFRGHTASLHAIAFSPDGQFLASGSAGGFASGGGWFDAYDNTVRIWKVATGEELARTDVGISLGALAFAPDGRHLVSGGGVERPGVDGSPGQRLRCDVRLWRLPESLWPKIEPAEEPDQPDAASEKTDAKPAVKPDAEREVVPEPAGPPETAPLPKGDKPQLDEEAEKTPPSENPDSQPGASDPTAN